MIANPDISYDSSVPHPFTLNDLRVQNTIADEPSPSSALTVAGLALAAVLAIGGFIWLDPLHLVHADRSKPAGAGIRPVNRTCATDREARDHCAADARPGGEVARSTEPAGSRGSGTAG